MDQAGRAGRRNAAGAVTPPLPVWPSKPARAASLVPDDQLPDIGRLSLEDRPEQAPSTPDASREPRPEAAKLASFDLEGVAALISSGAVRDIVVLAGAGISVSAGIPDFRTPGTGLYSRLAEYDLPFPEAVFHIGFFRQNPKPFYMLAKELYPGTFDPTPTHHFLALLHEKGLLRRVFTQNIDCLELAAGLPRDKVVAAHGSFDGARCIDCAAPVDVYKVQAAVFDDQVCECNRCGGLVKPDIVFFGEMLPARFHRQRAADLPQADLLIVLGTSLVVQPFASLIGDVSERTPRLLINREPVGLAKPYAQGRDGSRADQSAWTQAGAAGQDTDGASGSDSDSGSDSSADSYKSYGFDFDARSNTRDALHLGSCDDGVRQLCARLGWEGALDARLAAAAAARVASSDADEADDQVDTTSSATTC